ncbi:MAG: aryl-sulfate sulfotransferase [Thomasclavelia sp.]|nr:aryl-sulfate sulfotransferase [Thomasclavelia sp.]
MKKINENKKRIIGLLMTIALIVVTILGGNIKESLATTIEAKEDSNSNVYTFEYNDKNTAQDIYNASTSSLTTSKIETLKSQNNYTANNPLVIYNPYRTNNNSLYVYFKTYKSLSVKYTIHVDDDSIADYTNTLSSNTKKEHEYNLIGLVQGQTNIITLSYYNGGGKLINTKTITYDVPSKQGTEETVLSSTSGTSTTELENGLYTILGNDSDDQDFVYMYDNNGILRCEIPIIGYRAHTILFDDNYMYYSISQTKIAQVNALGEVTKVFSTGKYELHHDYTFDNDGNLLILANNTKKTTEEDCIIKIDIESGDISEVLDMESIFSSYVDTCTLDTTSTRDEGEDGLDWIHINSIEYINGDVILSSRETSSIIKITNLETNPKLDYLISDESIWEDSDYSDYVLTKIGDFKINAGQHSVRFSPSDQEGVYYLTFFDNNYGKANSQPSFDYTTIGITNQNAFKGDNSYYYVYKVDENNKTFELVDSMAVTYSGIVSSVQTLDNGNIVIDSGTAGVFSEYDSNHNLIKSFTMKLNKYMIYRVHKYSFNGFWFNK